MPDRLFSDPDLAALYDLFCPWDERADFNFYMPMIMGAESVLDIGCGTGMLLHRARDAGHTGRLYGLDPAPGMLEQARKRSDIEWVHGDLNSVSWDREFDLIIMTGHAFQVLVEDRELQTALTAIYSALTEGGRFAFETRNPLVREWENWTPDKPVEVTDEFGATVRMEYELAGPIERDIVRFSHTFTSSNWSQPRKSQSVLRFLDVNSLSTFLTNAGLIVEKQFGNWDRSSLMDASPEIITFAQRIKSS